MVQVPVQAKEAKSGPWVRKFHSIRTLTVCEKWRVLSPMNIWQWQNRFFAHNLSSVMGGGEKKR
jgi:hypothetical protein